MADIGGNEYLEYGRQTVAVVYHVACNVDVFIA